MSQKEFTFPVASSAVGSSRVARPAKVIPLGKALENRGGSRVHARTTVGTASIFSASSSSRDSNKKKKKYAMSVLQPTTSASSSSRHRASYHSPFHQSSDHDVFNSKEEDSFEVEDTCDVDWWGETNTSFEQLTSSTGGGTKAKIRKVKENTCKGSSAGPSSIKHILDRSKQNKSMRVEQSINRHRPEQAVAQDVKSVQSRSRRTLKAPSRKLGRSQSLGPSRDNMPMPKGSLLGAPLTDDESVEELISPSDSPDRRSRVRGLVSSADRSKSQERVPLHRPGPMNASPSIQLPSPGGTQIVRVKQGRVARPSRSASDDLGFPAAPMASVGSRATTTGSMRRNTVNTTNAFDPFAASEHNNTNKVSIANLPLQLQRRGMYNDKEAMLRKCKEIGISERMLQDMKQAGLIITEGKV